MIQAWSTCINLTIPSISEGDGITDEVDLMDESRYSSCGEGDGVTVNGKGDSLAVDGEGNGVVGKGNCEYDG